MRSIRAVPLLRTTETSTTSDGYRGFECARRRSSGATVTMRNIKNFGHWKFPKKREDSIMELRMLTTEAERHAFADTLVQIRSIKGAGFSETKRSHVGEVHLAFGRLYTVYDEAGPNPSEAIAGFVLHDLGTFPQSYPKPDLTHLPPEHVFECGELWAKAAGGARLARQAAWITVGLLQAEAVIAYPIFKPWNLTIPYVGSFERTGDPIPWPYA